MRTGRWGLIILLATLVGACGTAQARDAAQPALRLLDTTPLTVRGSNFRASERVRLVLDAKGRYVRIVRASGTGVFVTKFAVDADICTAFNLRAVGTAGSVAVAARKAPPECAPLGPVSWIR